MKKLRLPDVPPIDVRQLAIDLFGFLLFGLVLIGVLFLASALSK